MYQLVQQLFLLWQQRMHGATEVRASVTAQEGETEAPAGLRDLTKDDFHSFLHDAGGTLVVVDCYTDWRAHLLYILPWCVSLPTSYMLTGGR